MERTAAFSSDALPRKPMATFVLSTGRCGTQWLAWALAAAVGTRGRVAHEPLGDGYRPRLLLAGGAPERLPAADRERIEAHLATIEDTLRERDYYETGFPCWSALPGLLRRFEGRVRVVHLTRHPVPTAYSWQAHGAYVPPLLPYLQEKILLCPTDAGVAFPEYAERWPAMRAFERGLYHWAEVHAFGLALENRTRAPWLRLGYAELFHGAGWERLVAFLGWSGPAGPQAAIGEQVDRFRFQVLDWMEPEAILRHPVVCDVARRLGYDPAAVDVAALRRRYRAGGGPGVEVGHVARNAS
jgi:hypothetical protein